MNKILVSLALLLSVGVFQSSFGQDRTDVRIKNDVFSVSYNETLEQPNWVEYEVRNITKKFDRGSMDFYTPKDVYTSDNEDYKNNVWDKGHMAPAAAFTDTKEKLKTTFSYLNCSLQFDKLNRGAWRELEAQERVWAKRYGTLKVRIVLHFEKDHLVLPTGGHVPNGYWKHITFPNGNKECFYFPNSVPTKHWSDYEIVCQVKREKSII
jgi:endonuclease G